MLKQENDPDSLLNHLKKLINLRKSYPALAEDGDFCAIENGYPAVYERSLDGVTICVVINPSDREDEVSFCGEVLLMRNCMVSEGVAKVSGCGYLIYKK